MQSRAAAREGEQVDRDDTVPHEELISSDDRREHLRAAAEALRTWVHSQRETARTGSRPDAATNRHAGARQLATAPIAQAHRLTPIVPVPPAAPVVPAVQATPEVAVASAAELSPPQQRAVERQERPFRAMSVLGIGADDAESTESIDQGGAAWAQRAGAVGRGARAVGKRAGVVGRKAGALALRAGTAAARAGQQVFAAHREQILTGTRRAARVSGFRVLIVVAIAAIVSGVMWVGNVLGPKMTTTLATLAAPTTGTALLETVPPGSQVFIDGTAIGTTPITTHLSRGRHLVEFRRGESIRSMEIDVTAGESTVSRLDWTAKRTGVLRVESTPSGAKVVIDGVAAGVTPLETSNLTVGNHEVLIQGAAGSVRRTVNIRIDRPAQIAEMLYSGWMHVSSPIEVVITEGTRGLQLDDQNRMMLPPGDHELQFENQALGYREVRRVRVTPGETTQVVVAPSSSSLSVTATEAAEVFVDGERAGETPLTNHPVALGTRDIVVRGTSGAQRQFTTTVTAAPVQLEVDFATP